MPPPAVPPTFEGLKKMGRHVYVGRRGQQKEVGKRSKNSKGEECVELEESSLPNLAVEVRRKLMGKRRVKVSCRALLSMHGIECEPAYVDDDMDHKSDAESVDLAAQPANRRYADGWDG